MNTAPVTRNDTPGALAAYLQELRTMPVLTAAQEVELAKSIEAGLLAGELLDTRPDLDDELRADLQTLREEGERANQRMIECNLRLVVSTVKRIRRRYLPLPDLIAEGNLGLIRAVEKFDFTKGYKFSTYATWWIRQAVSRGQDTTGRFIRLPSHIEDRLTRIDKAVRSLEADLDREPTLDEIAAKVCLPPPVIADLQKIRLHPLSLDESLNDDLGTFTDIISDSAPDIADTIADADLAEQFHTLIQRLPARQARTLMLRFGLLDGQPKTLDEVGREFGVTRERIRQIETKALAALRQLIEQSPLAEHLQHGRKAAVGG
ncbi:sigma-70 family RNA polymerase sigma factor [Nonomuraea sp. NPDC046802]|uniref:sigma-70 family RNA polymerase sigma factor n=1 Tax=Nonomuraea sp. NPDC046802 TaxID=3154919 RepID=UPI0033D75EA5